MGGAREGAHGPVTFQRLHMVVTAKWLLHLEVNSDGCRTHPINRETLYSSAAFLDTVSQNIPSLVGYKLLLSSRHPWVPTVG